MKSKFLAMVMILLLAVSFSFSANTDRYYQGAVTPVDISYTQVSYKWVVTIGADSTDQLHSDALFIGDMNETDGFINAVVSAASDVNVIYHYSSDGYTWFTAITPADLDSTSNTAKQDTLGIQVGVNSIPFHLANWLIIEIDGGGSTCDPAEVVTITLSLTKDSNLVGANGNRLVLQSVKTRKPSTWTNP